MDERQLIMWAMRELDAAPERVKRLLPLPFKQAVEGLKELKAEVRKRYKKLALKWHPDRNKAEDAPARFKALTRVLEELDKLEVRQRPPMPMQQVFTVVFHNNSATTTSTANWAQTTAWVNRPGPTRPPRNYDARRVAYIRVDK